MVDEPREPLGLRLAHAAGLDDVFLEVSFLGSTKVVIVVSAIAALLAARRCPRLAARDRRDRPRAPGDRVPAEGVRELARVRLATGWWAVRGISFPSGHPLAAVASCVGTLPLVAALHTGLHVLW